MIDFEHSIDISTIHRCCCFPLPTCNFYLLKHRYPFALCLERVCGTTLALLGFEVKCPGWPGGLAYGALAITGI